MSPHPTDRSTTLARIAILTLTLVLAGPLVSLGAGSSTLSATYDMGSSVVVRDTFGFGVLLCATGGMPDDVLDVANNGPCLDYTGLAGLDFVATIHDDQFDATGFTAAVDINGDGCVSTSCRGIPNDQDYRVDSCGSVAGVLPRTDDGVAEVLQFFIRVIDLDLDTLETCFATQGEVSAIAG